MTSMKYIPHLYLLPDDSLNSAAILRFSDFSNEVFIMVLEEKTRS